MKRKRFLIVVSLALLLGAGISSCRKEQTIPVVIDASYSVVNNNYTVPVEVIFTNNTTGADHFLWTFEGGSPSTSNKKAPGVVEFGTAGRHKVTLEAWNDDERQVKEFFVQLDSAVRVAFDTSVVLNLFSPVTVKFTNLTTGGSSFAWTFEGGNPAASTLKNPPDVVFTTAGDHNITLMVRNGRDSFSLTKRVTVAPSLAADFSIVPSFDDEDYEAPLTAILQNNSVSGLTWQWSTSGGTVSNSSTQNPTVYFATAGTYQVTLIAGNGKATQTVTKTITVKPNSNLRTHSNVQLGISSAGASVGSFYSTQLRRVIKSSENLDTLGKWIDVVYFGINQNFGFNKIVSPDSAQAYAFPIIPQAQAVRIINRQEQCNCGASLTAGQFDAMATDAMLQNLSVNPTAAGWQSFNNATTDRIVLYQTADGRKGAIKVKQYVANGNSSYIIADLKYKRTNKQAPFFHSWKGANKLHMLKQQMNFKCLLTITCLLATASGFTQSMDVGNMGEKFSKKNLLQVNGGISANAILYSGNGSTIRNPFDYFVNGNLNVNLFNTINLPFSFNFTNTSRGFQYPTMPNRLSLHPRYKWAEGHIGDVNMTFSPYTLNGHQFTGAGFDFTPSGKLTGSVMYGRLHKAVAYDTTNPEVLPTYKRTGYGAKLEYAGNNYRIGFSTFAASDDVNSLLFQPDSLNVTPQKNLAISWNVSYRPAPNMELTAEYASSALTKDERDTSKQDRSEKSYIGFLMNDNSTTTYYHALKTQLNYQFKQSVIGIGYERVDPGYQTLGAYFFNNDLENITVNYRRPFFKDKVMFTINLGFQHDDLDGAKSGSNSRTVSALDLSYNPSDRFSTALSYSNFSTHMFIKPQFQQINQLMPFQNLDTLNFSQLSQNANLNVNYQLAKSDKKAQSINVNFSFFDAVDKQGGVVKNGNASQFYNMAAAYNLFLVPANLSITTAMNVSYNTIGRNELLMLGPTGALNAKLFKKQVTAGFSTSYNTSTMDGKLQSKVFNNRVNASYAYHKKHYFNLSLLHQARTIIRRGQSQDVVATIGYNYTF